MFSCLHRLITELFVSSGDGKISMSKIVMFTGLVTATYGMFIMYHNGKISVDLFAVYIAATLGTNSLNKFISVRSDRVSSFESRTNDSLDEIRSHLRDEYDNEDYTVDPYVKSNRRSKFDHNLDQFVKRENNDFDQ